MDKDGTITTAANVISGNTSSGLVLEASNIKILGNFIGVDKTGNAARANGGFGILFGASANDNQIGGDQAGARNIISSERGWWNQLLPDRPGQSSDNNSIRKNIIGLGKTVVLGQAPTQLPNGAFGIDLTNAGANSTTVKKNLIFGGAGNTDVISKKNAKIFDPNSMFGGDYGIDNGDMTNVPVISSAVVSGNTITITGTLTAASDTYDLEFFGNDVAERQGKYYLGTGTVTTSGGTPTSFSFTFDTVNGAYVTATSTGRGSTDFTSEFSDDVAVSGLGSDASVGSLVWEDLNGNGVQDSGESGIDDVAVDLYDSGDNLIASSTTDTTGNYQFTSITPGDYYLQFTAPSGYSFTTAFNGDDTLDSDAAPTDGDPTIALTPVVTRTAGESNPTLDAGLYQLGGV